MHENDIRVASSPLSVSSSLLTCESNDSLPLVDDVHVVSVDTLVDPIDDQIDSSCKINLCPPSVEPNMLNESTSSCVNGVDQLMCENFTPLEDVCDVINRTQVSEEYENISCCKTAKKLWDKLKMTYEGTEKVNQTHVSLLAYDYELFKMKDGESIEETFSRFGKIVGEFKSVGKTYLIVD